MGLASMGRTIGLVLVHVDEQHHGAPELAAWEERIRTSRPASSGVPDEGISRSSWFPLPWPTPLSSPPARSTRPSAGEGADLCAATVVRRLGQSKISWLPAEI